MDLSDRQQILLRELLQQTHWTSIERLSNLLDVSERTIFSDLECLDDYVHTYGCTIIRQPGRGIFVDGTEESKSLLREQLSEIQNQLANPLRTLLVHLTQHDWTTLDELSAILYVSRPVVARYVHKLEESLRQYELSIESRRGKGIRLKGTEAAYRRILQRLLLDGDFLSDRSTAVHPLPSIRTLRHSLDILMPGFPLDSVVDVVEDLQDELGQSFSDEVFVNIVVFISLAIIRMLQGHRYDLPCEQIGEEVGISEKLIQKLASKFGMSEVVVRQELGKVDTLILSATSDVVALRKNERIQHIVQRFCDALESFLGIPFSRNHKLIDSLLLHIHSSMMMSQLKQIRRNPLLQQVKREYPEIYFCLRDTADDFSEEDKCFLSPDELGYIAMHFGTSLMTNVWLVNVGFVTTETPSMTELAVSKLTREFPGLNVRVIPVHRVTRDQQWLEHLDLIISNASPGAISQIGIPEVHVNSWITDDDIRRCHHALNRVLQTPISVDNVQCCRRIDYDLKTVLRKAYWTVNIDSKKPEDIIKRLAEPFLQSGVCSRDFIAAVTQREQLGPSSMEYGIAMPHALLDNCPNGLVVSGGKLCSPIKWGDLYVDTVILMGVGRNSGALFLQFYDWLKKEISKLKDINTMSQDTKLLTDLIDVETCV
jgi:transcriptional antiterminator/mannitol/fructose-specific phosphotransferase system IIA component (Ntr-type)